MIPRMSIVSNDDDQSPWTAGQVAHIPWGLD
jgi:hypothetical protein